MAVPVARLRERPAQGVLRRRRGLRSSAGLAGAEAGRASPLWHPVEPRPPPPAPGPPGRWALLIALALSLDAKSRFRHPGRGRSVSPRTPGRGRWLSEGGQAIAA